ncbi:acetyl-CoA synthetase-like protein [Lichtheimia hyalospora FSU 10163]|nr:acetyl-CoA synthetase-like protein [Lichtheimia hyalospora FSU 10163]
MPPQYKPPYTVPASSSQDVEGETQVMRHFLFKDKLVEKPDDLEKQTMWEMYLHGYEIGGDRPFLGARRMEEGVAKEYVWQTHKQVRERIDNFAKGLSTLGLKRQKSLGVYSVNRPEWTISELACYRQAYVIVALYDTLGAEAMEYIINQVDMEFIVASPDKVGNIARLKDRLPTIKTVIAMGDTIKQEDKDAAAKAGLVLHTFQDVEKMGQGLTEEEHAGPEPNDIATICYTSGTTGVPKGAVLTHANCVAPIASISALGETGSFAKVNHTDVYISYLPMAHVFERAAQGIHVFKGASIGYYQGDTLKLLDDIAVLRPTVFCSVPRLFNKIYDKVLSGVKAKGGASSFLFNTAFNQKKANLHKTVHHWLWDKVVFAQIRAKLGGRIRFILSGSAPVSPDVMDFMRICFSARVFEGYGQTENFCGGCLTVQDDNTSGVVGVPFPCTEIKLIDVPDMEYLSTDKPYPRGEICMRGHSVMREYYQVPDKTAETIDSDGWLRTGDIGLFDSAGRLQIIDRRKNIFKLSQGEYIAPEKIEGVYQKHELIAQAFVYGDSLQPSVVGIIVPDKEALLRWASNKDMSPEQLCASEGVKKEILGLLTTYGKQNDLKSFEQIKALHLTMDEFTVDNDLLTPTFKLKREVAKNVYAEQIKDMYATLSNGRSFN